MPVKESMTLYQIQRQMAQAIMRPLIKGKTQEQWIDGSDTHSFVAQFIKPNKDLNSLERLAIYNQQYWIRLLDSLQDDFSGLQTILSEESFELLCVAYLAAYPSRSYSLNHLGEYLPKFILEQPELTHPCPQLAYEMASFEWAEIVAYDAQSRPPLKSKHLQDKDPAKITLQLQPYITILELDYALDDFILQMNKPIDKSVESNAFAGRTKKATERSLPVKKHIFVAVHRLDNIIYYKRLKSDQYFLLKAFKDGKTLAQACHDLIVQKGSSKNAQSLTRKLNQYFTDWMELHWFC